MKYILLDRTISVSTVRKQLRAFEISAVCFQFTSGLYPLPRDRENRVFTTWIKLPLKTQTLAGNLQMLNEADVERKRKTIFPFLAAPKRSRRK